MDERNMNQGADPASGQGDREKTFTQEDVNRIVQERLAKEKARGSGEADFAKREKELAQRELKLSAKEALADKGLPAELLDALNCTDEAAMAKSIETIEKVINGCRADSRNNMKFKGFQPAASADISIAAQTMGLAGAEDAEIRRAMRLGT